VNFKNGLYYKNMIKSRVVKNAATRKIDSDAAAAKIRRKKLTESKKQKAAAGRELKKNARIKAAALKKAATAAKRAVKASDKAALANDKKRLAACKELVKSAPTPSSKTPSDYNRFVKDSMKRPGIIALAPRNRLRRIGFLWKAEKRKLSGGYMYGR
jgi:hypothetical protein